MYKIRLTRSTFGNFYWALIGPTGKSLAESHMYKHKEGALHTIRPISKALNAKMEFLDLEGDWEE